MSDPWQSRHRGPSRTRDMFEFASLAASRESIKAMPRVHVTEKEAAAGLECPICLDNYEVGSEASEMPCKHWFHSGCIKRWLGLRKSCPICRFVMPAEKKMADLWWQDVPLSGGSRGSGSVFGSRGRREVDDPSTPMDVDDEVDDSWDPMEVD